MASDGPKHVMTPAMLAERWQCSERHVRTMLNSGQLPFFKLGGKLMRIKIEDVERFEADGVTENRR